MALSKGEDRVLSAGKSFDKIFSDFKKCKLIRYEKKRIEEGKIVNPRVVLEVKTKMGFLKVKFSVDSGADVTTLPINPYAELLDFKKDSRSKVIIGRIEGGEWRHIQRKLFSLNYEDRHSHSVPGDV